MINRTRPIFIALAWLASVILPLPLVFLLNRGIIDTPSHLFAYDCGVFAYIWWLMIVILATRPRWMIQQIGMPALYGIHGGLGVMALIAATIHRFTSFSMFPLIRMTGTIAWYLEIFLLAYAVLFLSGWLVDRLTMVRRLKEWLEHHLLIHQVTMWIHRLNFVVIGLIWLHVNLIPRLRNASGFILTFNIYTAIILAIYCWWKLCTIFRQPQGTVEENHSRGDTQELVITLKNGAPKYRAGDFYFLSFQGVNSVSSEPHPFSVSSAPAQAPTRVKFIIQRRGDFTRTIPLIAGGTRVKLEGPYGMFDREVDESTGPIILYGLGTGVAPLLSLARQYANQKDIQLLWSGPAVDSEDYQGELSQLKKMGVQISIQSHRFTLEQLAALIGVQRVRFGQVIIVGLADKVLHVRKTLHKIGFKYHQLHDERITL